MDWPVEKCIIISFDLDDSFCTWIGPTPCRSSFNLLGVIASGKEPITTRFDGFPLLEALVTTTRLALASGVEPDVLLLLSEGPTTIRCKIKRLHFALILERLHHCGPWSVLAFRHERVLIWIIRTQSSCGPQSFRDIGG